MDLSGKKTKVQKKKKSFKLYLQTSFHVFFVIVVKIRSIATASRDTLWPLSLVASILNLAKHLIDNKKLLLPNIIRT